MNNDLKIILNLRKKTGSSISDCRKALSDADGDVEGALDLLTRNVDSNAVNPFAEEDQWFTSPPLTSRVLKDTEQVLGFKFPQDYIDLLYIQNGGVTKNTCFPMLKPTSWAEDHISITGIRGVGGKYGIDKDIDKKVAEDWGYPVCGFVFAETPTAGHTVLMFDYSLCGSEGVPRVLWVDTYGEEVETIVIAENFSQFISGLKNEDLFNTV